MSGRSGEQCTLGSQHVIITCLVLCATHFYREKRLAVYARVTARYYYMSGIVCYSLLQGEALPQDETFGFKRPRPKKKIGKK
ncbi:hypothetical protein J6590_078180 [Homalodisca vitripennis]|nr:hypothetical protein J6590_078180 [Homalodisca vitripennis]